MNPKLLRFAMRLDRDLVKRGGMMALTEVAMGADFKYGVMILEDETLPARMAKRWGFTEPTWKKKLGRFVDAGVLRIDQAPDTRHSEPPPQRTYVRLVGDELMAQSRQWWEDLVDRARFAVTAGQVPAFTRSVDDERRRLVSHLGLDPAEEPLIREQLAQLDDLDGAVDSPDFYLGVEEPATMTIETRRDAELAVLEGAIVLMRDGLGAGQVNWLMNHNRPPGQAARVLLQWVQEDAIEQARREAT